MLILDACCGVRMSLWKRWRQGMKDLSPLQLLRAKWWGLLGQSVGMVFSTVYVVFVLGLWYWGVFLFFTLIVLLVEFKNVSQQKDRLERLII